MYRPLGLVFPEGQAIILIMSRLCRSYSWKKVHGVR